MHWFIPLIILVLLEATADIVSKTWQLRGGWYLAAIALLTYLVANAFWLLALKNGAHLSKGAVLFSVMSAVLAVIIGVVVYKESLNTIQTIGLTIGNNIHCFHILGVIIK